eukprot:3106993-Rhodomonas_salina.2
MAGPLSVAHPGNLALSVAWSSLSLASVYIVAAVPLKGSWPWCRGQAHSSPSPRAVHSEHTGGVLSQARLRSAQPKQQCLAFSTCYK